MGITRQTFFLGSILNSSKVFGDGKIVLVNTEAFCYTIKFDSLKTERSISFGAALEKV